MSSGSSSQRGASRSGRSTSTAQKTSSGGSSARTRKSAATSSSSPRKSRTPSKPRGTTGAARGARRSPSRTAPRRDRGPLVPLAVIGAIVLLVWSMYPALKVQYETGRRLAGLEAQYKDMSAKNKALRAQVADLKTPAGVERAARENLGLARPGENVYVVMPASVASGQPATSGAGSKAASGGKDVVTALLDAIFGVR